MFSISIDSTFDASRREQVSFVIRYVDDTFGLIHERVIAIKESPIITGKDLYSLFVAIMEKEKLNWKDCLVGQSYDGASNMRGNYKGLQAHIKRECPQALYVWCHAHRLALVVKQAVSCDSNSRDLFGNLESLYVLLWCSKKRAATFREAQKKHSDLKYTQEHAVKRVCTTRWNSHSAALNVVIKFHHAVLQTLEEIKNLEGVTDATVGANCSGLIDYFTSRRFLFTAFTFKKLFDILEVVTRQFQTHDMDILLATSIVTKTINSIRKLRANNSFEEIIKLTDNFINESDTDFIPLKNIRPRRVPIKAGELMQDDPIVCPIKKFEVETYNAVIDMTLNELSDRFETTNIGPLKDIALLSYRRIQEVHNDPTMLPKDSFIELCEVYSKINRDCLISEYMQFCKNLNEFENNLNLPKFLHDVSNNKSSNDEDENDNNDDNISMLELNTYDDLNETSNDNDQRAIKNIGSTKKIFQMFCTANLTSCFPNLYVALKLSVTLPISSCSVERSFSKLKLIKTKLRTSMLQDRLENLMKISCEKDLNPIVDNIILSLAGKSSSLCKALVY